MQPNKAHIQAHLEFLFKDIPAEYQDGKIEIAYTSPNNRSLNRAHYFDVHDIPSAVEFVCKTNSQEGVNIYVGAALRVPDCPPFGRSNLTDYYVASAAWADIDDADAAAKAKEIYKDLPPSLIVVTGRQPATRFQAWYKLRAPEQDNAELKKTLSGIKHALNGDPAVVDPARVMRVGGSVAWPKKEGRVTELTEVAIPSNATPSTSEDALHRVFPPQTTVDHVTGEHRLDDGKPRNIFTGNLEVQKLLEATKEQGQWNANMLLAIGSMIGRNWTDEQIRIACAPYSEGAANDGDIFDIINRTRVKFNAPEPVVVVPLEQKLEGANTPADTAGTSSLIPYSLICDLQLNLKSDDFVHNLFSNGALSVIYGESNCGKSFFVMDIAFHVAQGIPYRDRRVEQGVVVYVALEGGQNSFIKRVKAHTQHNVMLKHNMPIVLITTQIDFLNPEGNIEAFIRTIDKVAEDHGGVKMVVVDTLARAIAGGDENSGQDMGLLVSHADTIRQHTGAHICFVHHSGKNRALGARGHSSLRAAVDTEIEISRDENSDHSTIKVVKQREMEMSCDMHFKLKPIVLGVNEYDEEITSCVVQHIDAPEETRKETRLSPIQQFVYDAVVNAMIDNGKVKTYKDVGPVKQITYNELREMLEEMGYKRVLKDADNIDASDIEDAVKSSTQSARVALRDKGYINFNAGGIWLAKDEV